MILCHRNPDADTIGAGGALAFYISRFLNKPVKIFCPDELPSNLDFLGLADFILPPAEPELKAHDLIISVDCGDTTQTGISEKFLEIKNKIPTVSIDHHQTNTYYADLNIVEPTSATAEIIYKIFKTWKSPLTKEISTCLLTGIITDTTYFTNAGTTKESMAIASELLKRGAAIKTIIQNTWKKNSPEALKVWGKILSQLHYNAKYKIVAAVISKEDAILPEVFEGLANFLTTLYEANIIIVIRETEDGFIKCSLRTTKDHVDVSRLAQKFGGGGHAKAAGFSLRGKLTKTAAGWRVAQKRAENYTL